MNISKHQWISQNSHVICLAYIRMDMM